MGVGGAASGWSFVFCLCVRKMELVLAVMVIPLTVATTAACFPRREVMVRDVHRGTMTTDMVVELCRSRTGGRCDDECSICLGATEGANTLALKCGHVFHDECIIEWLSREPVCPLCRSHAFKRHRRRVR